MPEPLFLSPVVLNGVLANSGLTTALAAAAAQATPVAPVAAPAPEPPPVAEAPPADVPAAAPLQPIFAAPLAVATEFRFTPPVLDFAKVKWLNPDLGAIISEIKPHDGEPRAAMTVPICPAESPSDTLVYEAPGNPAERFYLPRYRVGTIDTDQGTQLRLRLTRQDPGTRIAVVLEPFMAPEVAAAAPDATPLAHDLTAVLGFELPGGGGARREFTLTDRADVEGGVELSLVVPTLADRGDLYNALTMAEAHASFLVHRTITVAVPTGSVPGNTGIVPPHYRERVRELPWLRRRLPLRVPDAPGTGPDPVVDPPVIVDPPVAGPQVLRRLPDVVAARGPLLDLPRFEGRVDAVAADPGFALPTVQTLYRATTRPLSQVVDPTPFVFSPNLHGYVYGDITGSGGQGGMVLEQIAHGGRHHSYYYSTTRPEVVYYLPDAFKLARVPEAPHAPMMSVAFDAPDGTAATSNALVVFAASSVVSADRLVAAASALAAKRGANPGSLDLQPLLADSSRLTLRVALPGSAGSSTVLGDARIDLRAALSAGFTLPLAHFQAMFDRIRTGGNLFDGEVEVRLDRADRPAEKIPVVANLADLAGPLVDILGIRQDAEPRYQFTVTNAIESPVRLDTLVAHLPQPAGPLPCEIQGMAASPTLAPGASLTGMVVPITAPTDPEVLPVVTLTAATVTPDADALWDAICEDTTSHISRDITVKTPAQLFAAPADGSSPILALVIEVAGLTGGLSTTVELSAAALEQKATIAVPLADLVKRTTDSGDYRYRVSTVRADRVADGDWKTKSGTILWIVSADVG